MKVPMNELEALCNQFETKIQDEDLKNNEKDDKNGLYNFYVPKIRYYFIPYLRETISEQYVDRQRLFFETVFNREYLIESTIYYVENCKTKGVADNSVIKRSNSISDFLIAFGRFNDLVLKLKYNMTSINSCLPATEELVAEVRMRLEKKGYTLLEAEEFPSIQQTEYEYIISYFDDLHPFTDRQLQIYLIFQLTLLYGLSFSTIRNIKLNDIDLETRTLKILSKNKKEYITLELPYKLYINIRTHIKNSHFSVDEELFFYTKDQRTNGKCITSSFINNELEKIRNQYKNKCQCDDIVLNRFTHYGLIKYAISNMLVANINIPTIVNLTNRDIKSILSVRPQNAYTSEQQSNYINAKLRSIETYNNI